MLISAFDRVRHMNKVSKIVLHAKRKNYIIIAVLAFAQSN